MFNSSQYNTQLHNGFARGVPFTTFTATRQIIVRPCVLEVNCRQIIWNQTPGDIATVQVVYAVLRDETHIVQV